MAHTILNPITRKTINQRSMDATYSQLELESTSDFAKKNAQHLHSQKIYTSDFPSFNEATQKLEFPNLKNLEIVWNSDPDDMISPDFLDRCTALQKILLCHQALRFLMRSIVKLRTFKTLHIRYDKKDNMDDLLVELISRKGASIKRLFAKIEQFPPRWLMGSAMAECQDLETLALDARMSRVNHNFTKEYLEKHVPTLKSLKNLWIVGDGICMRHLMLIIDHCPNLKKLEIDRPDRVVYINVVMKLERINKPRLKVSHSKFVLENVTRIDFK